MKKRPDHFYRKAKDEGYAARSVFKLQEMDAKYKLIKPGNVVLDLGAAPGSWLAYLAQRVGPSGIVVGVDILSLKDEPKAPIVFVQKSLFDLSVDDLHPFARAFHAVVSDAAPQTTGQRDIDHAKSAEICRQALHLAKEVLVGGGHFICKMYQGDETRVFLDELKLFFDRAKIHKPLASRKESREIFFLASGYQKQLFSK